VSRDCAYVIIGRSPFYRKQFFGIEKHNMYHVYVIESQIDKSHYIGFTEKNPFIRLNEHNHGKVTSSKNKRPRELVYYEGYNNKKDALLREKFLKGGSGHTFLKNQLKYYLQS